MGMEPEKVGLAQDDQRDPGGHLGSGQQNAAGQRPARKVGERQGRACGQHRHGGADPRTKRQQSFVGLRAGDGSSSAAGGFGGQHHSLARSLPRGEEAGSGDRVYPRSPETGSALPRSAQDRPEHPGLSAAGGGTVAAGGRPGGQTLAGPGSPLSATDHADHRPDRAAGASRRSSAGRREACQPVRTACRHHRQGQPRRRLRT